MQSKSAQLAQPVVGLVGVWTFGPNQKINRQDNDQEHEGADRP